MRWTWLNNQFVEEEKAVIGIHDLAIQRGYGIFDFFRTRNNKPLYLDDHLERFFHSATLMRLKPPQQKHELKAIIEQLIAKNNIPESGIKITLTGGYSTDAYTPATPNLIIQQQPVVFPKPEQYNKGLRLISHHYQRELPQAKSINYLMGVWMQEEVKNKGADDVLYYQNGIISELPRSNIFMITHEDILVTPVHNILHGVTRKHILQIAKNHFEIEERDISLDELYKAKEVFISSTTKKMLPVIEIDKNIIDGGIPGNCTALLFKEFRAFDEKESLK